MTQSKTARENPLLKPSPLPFGLPPFAKIKDADFEPAFEASIAEHLREINAIAHSPAPPTFDNTIVAMERAGEDLTRVGAIFGNLTASNTNPTLDRVQSVMAPKLAAHSDAIFLDADLFKRVHALFERRAALNLDPESLRLLERYHTRFVRASALLGETDKAKLRELNKQLSTLTTNFKQAVLKGVNASVIVVESQSELDGLSAEQIAVAAEAAQKRNLAGKWVIPLLNTTQQPTLANLKNRALRERIYRASITRG
ncbi:MAG TPA: hypothetical protein VET48_05745, partial [Steroidobacteraceae bacterium]|nr:hypothetical protein [Steroidobacteraceae bacterium]